MYGVPGTPAQAVRQAGRPANAGHGVDILAGGATPGVGTTTRSHEPTHSGIRAASPGCDARKDAENRDCSIATGADSKIARQEQGESTWDPLNASELAPNSANGLIPRLIAWAKSQSPGNIAIVSENQEVRLVGGEERLDACLPVSCGKERIQQSLAAQRELLQPCEKLPHGTSVGERLHDVARRPPLLGNVTCRVHVERLRETTGVGDDMDELRQYLRGDSDDVARREHLRQRNARQRARRALLPPRPQGTRCRGHGSWPTFQHFAEQVVVGSQRTKYRAQAHGRDVEDAVRPRAFHPRDG